MFAEKVLRKHVSIIHAYSLMSALQRKIINVLLYEATEKKLHSNSNYDNSIIVEYTMHFSHFVKLVNFKSNNTQYLKEAIDGLASLKIEWNLLKDKVPTDISFINLRVLHGAPTFYKNGTFNFSFHKLMLNLIGNPSVYGSIDIDVQAKFESKYGLSLYENSTRFVHLQKSKIIQLDTFRKLLGVQENKYPSMREFTRNVMKPSIEEVNDCAEFLVDIENIKMGRKVTAFEMSVRNKKKFLQPDKIKQASNENKTYLAIKNYFGEIREPVLSNILDGYSEDYILEKIAYMEKYVKREKNGFYPIPYFISALKKDYRSIEKPVNIELEPRLGEREYHAWQTQLYSLEADLNLWKQHLEHAERKKDSFLTKNAQLIILDCEKKIQQHILDRPTKELNEKDIERI